MWKTRVSTYAVGVVACLAAVGGPGQAGRSQLEAAVALILPSMLSEVVVVVIQHRPERSRASQRRAC